jgi:hypothetical protein
VMHFLMFFILKIQSELFKPKVCEGVSFTETDEFPGKSTWNWKKNNM